MTGLLELLAAVAIVAGAPNHPTPYPAEDDAVVDAAITLAAAAWGADDSVNRTGDLYLVYESGRTGSHLTRTAWAGVVDSHSECSLGMGWSRTTRRWTSFKVECP